VFAVDGTSWPRCDAETSPERGYYYHPSRHSAGKPIVAGWWYQQVSQLNFGKDSWTWPADCRRIHPLEDGVAVTAGQVRALLSRLGPTAAVPLFAFDGGYDPIALAEELGGENAQILVRIKADRVFYADPPPRAPGAKGRPRRHGSRFDCKQPGTWPEPGAHLITCDDSYGTVTVTARGGLHPQLAARGRWAGRPRTPIVRGWVIRVDVQHLPRPSARAKKTLWLWWSGPPGTAPDPTCAGGPTSAGSTSSTPSSSKSPPWAGLPHRCGCPGKPTGGPRSSSPATLSSCSPGPWPPTSVCPGSSPATRAGSPPAGCAGIFPGFARCCLP
jgi:DDE superfamily endonuclease